MSTYIILYLSKSASVILREGRAENQELGRMVKQEIFLALWEGARYNESVYIQKRENKGLTAGMDGTANKQSRGYAALPRPESLTWQYGVFSLMGGRMPFCTQNRL